VLYEFCSKFHNLVNGEDMLSFSQVTASKNLARFFDDTMYIMPNGGQHSVVLLWYAGNAEATCWNCSANLPTSWTHWSQRTKRHHLRTLTHLPIALPALRFLLFFFCYHCSVVVCLYCLTVSTWFRPTMLVCHYQCSLIMFFWVLSAYWRIPHGLPLLRAAFLPCALFCTLYEKMLTKTIATNIRTVW